MDLDQHRIVYYKNGQIIGVAFNNIRVNTLIRPAVSVSYDSKVEGKEHYNSQQILAVHQTWIL